MLVYNDYSARPILAMKRAGRRDGLSTMARWMQRAASDVLGEADMDHRCPVTPGTPGTTALQSGYMAGSCAWALQ